MIQLTRWPIWLRYVLAAGLGAVAAFGLAPFGYWVATLISLAAMSVLFLSVRTKGQAALLGWLFASGYFAHALMWIVEPFFVDAERYAWMAPFALILMAGGMALFWAPAFWFAMRPALSARRRVWSLVLYLSIGEFARGYLFTGFPWAGLAQIWVDTPVAQLLSLVGPNGLGALTLAVTLPSALVFGSRFSGRALLGYVAPLTVFAVVAFVYAGTRPAIVSTGQTVRINQPNAPQHQKWDPAYAPTFFNRQIEFTAAEPKPDLVVWPETSVPVWLENADPTLRLIADAAGGVPVVLGIQRSENLRIYNSMVVLDGTGALTGVYDKHHLVPFGEYVPFGDLMARFGIYGFAATTGQGFSSGPGAALLSLGTLGPALPLICYEAVFPQDILAVSERPALLLQITNDAWFGTRSGPYQHLAQARMRAIEQGLPMVRSANTGISAMIDPLGRVTAFLPLDAAGNVDAELAAPLTPTFYSRTGDSLFVFLSFVLVLLIFFLEMLHKRKTD